MSDIEARFKALQRKSREQEKQVDILKGKLAMVTDSFKELGVTAKTASSKIKKLSAEMKSMESELDELISDFEDKYDAQLQKDY